MKVISVFDAQIHCRAFVTHFFVSFTTEAVNVTRCCFRFGTLLARNVSGASRMPTTATLTEGLIVTDTVPTRCHSPLTHN